MRLRSDLPLIELLVVVAITAILAVMLLPVLNRAREAARQAVCLSQQKQLDLAMNLYTDVYNGVIPCGCPTERDNILTFFSNVIRGWGRPLPANRALWVYAGLIPGRLLLCSSHSHYVGDRWHSRVYRYLPQWNSGLPPAPLPLSNDSINGGLTRCARYLHSQPWHRDCGPYPDDHGAPDPPWELDQRESNWPLLADLRQPGRRGHGGPCVSANHFAAGHNELCPDDSAVSIVPALPPGLLGVVKGYMSVETNHSALCRTWEIELTRQY